MINMTDSTCTFFADYNNFVSSIKATKSSTNPHFKNRFAPLDVWLDEVHRLAGVNNFIMLESMSTETTDGGDIYMLHTATIMHQQGFTQKSTYLVGLLDKPQAMGASVTYARRYNVQVLLTCTGEDDDDGNIAQTATTNTTTTTVAMKKRLA
jgi:hypothetical protein